MDTFRALAPPEGLKFTPLFDEPLGNDNARIARLEHAVQRLRNDIDTIAPTMVRLVAVEKDIRDLVEQLRTLTEAAPTAPAAPGESVPIPDQFAPLALQQQMQEIPGEGITKGTETVAEPSAAGPTGSTSPVTPEAAPKGELPPEGAASPSSAPAAKTPPAGQPSVPGVIRDVRVGDHPDKTRIVLDMTAKAQFVARLEDGGKMLVIGLPNMDMSSIQPFIARRGALVVGWRVEGQELKVELLYPSAIRLQDILPPSGTPLYRLVIDLHSPEAHG